MNKVNHFIFCIIDDVRSTHFFELIRKGYLPTFKNLMEQGLYSQNCVTDFPSITFPTQVSLITGTYTGNYLKEPCHGVPLYNWMDRSFSPPILRSYGTYGSDRRIQIYKMNDDLGNNCKTILEMFEGENTVSITQFINRGVRYFFPENKMKLIMYYLLIKYSPNIEGFLQRANLMSVKHLLDLFKSPYKYFKKNEAPVASLLYFFSSDLLMHLRGFESNSYKLNLMHIDKVIRLLLDGLKELGYLDSTALIIVSDHGNYRAKKLGNLTPFLEKNALVNYGRKVNNSNINVAEFGSVGFIYLKSRYSKNEQAWKAPSLSEIMNYGPKKVNLINQFFKIEGVNLIYHKDDEFSPNHGTIHVKRSEGADGRIVESFIDYEGIGGSYKTRYRSENPNEDAFNYSSHESASKLLDNRFHSVDEWLSATHHLDFPMYTDLIPRHFKNPRGADIVISTLGEVIYNIKHGKRSGDSLYAHDIGLKESSIVPLIIGGSENIPHKEWAFCKVTDVVPTILRMMGKIPHKSVIGRDLMNFH
jgi:predicted AlkP superfamily pyrophosphatase or phosphodiesterase